MTKESEKDRSGTQSIERAVAILRELSTRGNFGWPMSELAARCHLGKSTAHRILACLVRERLVSQRTEDRHYVAGPLLFELGLSQPSLGDLQQVAQRRLESLAKRTSCAAFLFLRSGDDSVCAVRVGSRKLKSLAVFRGSRRPLVGSTGGVAILLGLPPKVARSIIRRNFAAIKEFSGGEERLNVSRTMIRRAYEDGFVVSEGYLVKEMNAYGLVLPDDNGEAYASISIAGPASLLSTDRLPEIKRLMQETVTEIRDEVRETAPD